MPTIEIYDCMACAVFFRNRQEFGGLSNMHGGYPLVAAGVRFQSSETLYQSCRFPFLPRVQEWIIEERAAWAAKQMSVLYKHWSRPDWDDVRVPIMAWCLRVKLAQHRERFGALQLSTGERPIVEQSYRDHFWGAKPVSQSSDQLIGRNALGRLLVRLRAEYVATGVEAARRVLPPDIPNLLMLGREMHRDA